MLLHRRIRLCTPALFLVTILLAGCTVPLGPGFHFISRQTSIRQVSATSSHVHVRVADQLTNGGTRALSYLDVALPAAVDPANLNIQVDGKKAQAAPLNGESGAPLRIRFEPPWPQQQTKSFVFDYELARDSSRPVVATSSGAFHVADPDALPHWLPPPGFFVTADSQARREDLDIATPAAFRVAAAGSEQHPKQQSNLTTHHFRVSKTDFIPFMVAGGYLETTVHTDRGNVIFWTLQPLDPKAAQIAAERLAGTEATYEKIFGAASKHPAAIRIVEVPEGAATRDEGQAVSFPYGVLLGQSAFAKGIADDSVLAPAEAALARTWFGWVAQPAPQDEVWLGRGAGLFATVLAAEARGGETARNNIIAHLLAGYDANQSAESIAVVKAVPPAFGYKAALFWVALEDQAGAEPLQRAIRHMLQALAGKEIKVADLRAALESETGNDLAGVFHAWIDHPGLPADFRARYATAGTP